MRNQKLFGIMTLFVLLTIALAGVVAAQTLPITLHDVEIDGVEVQPNAVNRLDIERDQEIEVRLEFTPSFDVDDVEWRCFISGFEFSDFEPAEDLIPAQDYDTNVTYVRHCTLKLSEDFEEDDYRLRILASDRKGETFVQTYNLKVDVPRNELQIEDIVFYPANTIEAGKALLTTVRVENTGEKDQDDVRITVAIPDLGLSATDYIDEIEFDDEEETEEIFLRIPQCVEAGNYPVEIVVEYDERHREVAETVMLRVEADDTCVIPGPEPGTTPKAKSTILFGSDTETVAQGANAFVGVTIKNEGTTSRTYTLSVNGASHFADVRVTPQNTVVVGPGEEKQLSLFVAVHEDAVVGPQVFTATITSTGIDAVQQAVTVNVTEGSGAGDVSKVLEIALIVLIVILVIIGLVVAFNKLKNDGEEDEDDLAGQTYY